MSFARLGKKIHIPIAVKLSLAGSLLLSIILLIVLLLFNQLRMNEWSKNDMEKSDALISILEETYPNMDLVEDVYSLDSIHYSLFKQNNLIYTNSYHEPASLEVYDRFFYPHEKDDDDEDFDDDEDDFERDESRRVINRLVELDGGDYTLQISFNRDAEIFSDELYQLIIILMIPIVIIFSFLVNYRILKRSLKQVALISESAQNISTQSLDQRIPRAETRDELSKLTDVFNDMLDRISDGVEEQKRFTADASHELRTPLAALSGYISMAKRWGAKDEKILEETWEALERECVYMKHLTQNLLSLSRIDNAPEVASEIIDIQDVLTHSQECFQTLYPQRNIILNSHSVEVRSSAEYIQQLMAIVIENALVYSPDEVVIEMKVDDKLVHILVQDKGPGIPEDQIEQVFERFYRLDKVRSRNSGGTGLGLALAREICGLLGGSIEFLPVEIGACCLIKIPI